MGPQIPVALLTLLLLVLAHHHGASAKSSHLLFGTYPIGSPCRTNDDCVGQPDRSECTSEMVCACLPGYVAKVDNSACLPIVNELGGDCQEYLQCVMGEPGSHSECNSESRCACASHAINPPGEHRCYPIRYLDQPCTNSIQCSLIGNATCAGLPPSQMVCTCRPGFMPNPIGISKCYKLAEVVGDPCESYDSQCDGVEGSTCSVGTRRCECPANWIPSADKRKCLRKAELDQPCEDDAQCDALHSECREDDESGNGEKICLCVPDHVESQGYPGSCIKIIYEIGEICMENIQCSAGLGENVECNNGRCKCKFFYDGPECTAYPGLGDVCHSNEECVQGVNNYTMCASSDATFDYRCKCIPEAVQVGDTCVMKRIGDGCTSDAECAGGILGDVGCDQCTKTCWCRGESRPSHDWASCSPPTCLA